MPECHNPCFSRKLFAILKDMLKLTMKTRHNPCFSRKLFAIGPKIWLKTPITCEDYCNIRHLCAD